MKAQDWMCQMRVFPASMPLDGRTVIVTGHGPMAQAKARLFLTSPARLKWFTGVAVDPVPADIAQYARVMDREPIRSDLHGAMLLFIAGGEDAAIAELAATARELGVLVNIVDSPAASDFQTPAIVDRDGIVISIASGGAAPVLSVDIRAAIETLVPARIGVLADLARELRGTVKSVIKRFDDRRAFWERALRGKARDLAPRNAAHPQWHSRARDGHCPSGRCRSGRSRSVDAESRPPAARSRCHCA